MQWIYVNVYICDNWKSNSILVLNKEKVEKVLNYRKF